MSRTLVSLALGAALLSACSENIASPSCYDAQGRGETQLNWLDVACTSAPNDLQCQSIARIRGSYVYCPREVTVTSDAAWTVGDPSIISLAAPGVFRAVAAGNTVIRASWQNLQSVVLPVAVFPGMPPRRTQEIFGMVSLRGTLPTLGIDGARVEILDGIVAGRSVVSGAPPSLLPGYASSIGTTGYYRLLGIPPGTYHVRVTRAGYVTQEREVTVTEVGSPLADFPLDPSS